MQHRANDQLETFLDNNAYDESQLIELKIPVHLPYQISWTSFERYNGEIELNGIMYKYVKRKLAHDTLYLKCIPNTKEMHLQSAKNDFFKISNGLLQNNPKKTDNSKLITKILQTVYNGSSFAVQIISPYCDDQNYWLPLNTNKLISVAHCSPEQPPDPFIA